MRQTIRYFSATKVPHECKFKYDILMYEKEGRVPYVDPTKTKPQPQPQPTAEKK